ncbi:MAG: methyltransferase domain-containing protein [Candidatus Pacebacteria bacterium]|nr:methyltransferase domain-containing protein [Candidatus Paceibacterota bacterium]
MEKIEPLMGKREPLIDPKKSTEVEYYTNYYKRLAEDSPRECQSSMVGRILKLVGEKKLDPARVLDIGSGRQTIGKQLIASGDQALKEKLKAIKFVSVDIANIGVGSLPALKRPNFKHYRADAAYLPFEDNSFSLIVSNLAIDFVEPREAAFREAYRVLGGGGRVVFYLHHPHLFNSMDGKNEKVQKSWKDLKDNGRLFADENEIRSFLEKIGFSDVEIVLNNNKSNREKWWEVVAKK